MAAKLSAAQLAVLCRSVGIPESQIPTAVAIAFAESSGIPDRRNPVPPDDSYGLWQINMLGSMGPARRKQFGLSSNKQLYDPYTNARAMAAISNGGRNWGPWSTYTNGAYRLYLPSARQGVSSARTQVSQAGWSWDDIVGDSDDFKKGYENPFGLGDLLDKFGMRPDYDKDFGDGDPNLPDDLEDPFGEAAREIPGMEGLTSIASSIAAAGEWLSDSHNWVRVAYISVGGILVVLGLGIMARPLASNAVGNVADVLPTGKAVSALGGK